MTLLLATHRRASEIDRLIDELRRRQEPFIRANMSPGEDRLAVSIDNSAVRIMAQTDGGEFDLGEVTTAWYHQPPLSPPDRILPRAGKQAILTSYSNTWEAALAHLDALWLNSPSAVLASANKLHQLLIAQKIGMRIPPTTVGNISAQVRSYFGGQPTIAKNVADLHRVWNSDNQESFVTKHIDLANLGNAAIEYAPVIYQRALVPTREFRVVVVGAQTYAVALGLEDRRDYVDVRLAPNVLTRYEPAKLDSTTTGNLLRLMGEMGLGYCSADLVEGPDGHVFLIELNSCGAWWWVDDHYGGSITRAIADNLTSGH